MHSTVKLIAFLLSLAVMCGCGKRDTSPSNPNCVGLTCASWSTVKSSGCQQFNPAKQNNAFDAARGDSAFSLPIHLYLTVAKTDASGVYAGDTPEQHFMIPSGQGLVLPICQFAQYGTMQVYTNAIHLHCATNRSMTFGSTSANCVAGELVDWLYDGTNSTMSELLKTKTVLTHGNRTLAPRTLAPDEVVDCTQICNESLNLKAHGSDDQCIPMSSTSANARALNFVESWSPGKPMDKATAMATLGVTGDPCNRDEKIVDSSGRLSNTGEACKYEMSVDDPNDAEFRFQDLEGAAADINNSRRLNFTVGKSPFLKFPKKYDVLSGSVYDMTATKGTYFVDMRTSKVCVRIDAH